MAGVALGARAVGGVPGCGRCPCHARGGSGCPGCGRCPCHARGGTGCPGCGRCPCHARGGSGCPGCGRCPCHARGGTGCPGCGRCPCHGRGGSGCSQRTNFITFLLLQGARPWTGISSPPVLPHRASPLGQDLPWLQQTPWEGLRNSSWLSLEATSCRN
uniref:Uncharacterized protein n=1 Tax=Corvus moneduloides TaxID=1196302 RepID=A0A8U7P312_CORMO